MKADVTFRPRIRQACRKLTGTHGRSRRVLRAAALIPCPAWSVAEVEVVPGAVCGGVDVVARGGVDVGGADPGAYARGPGVSEVDDGLAVGPEGEVLRVRGVPLAA